MNPEELRNFIELSVKDMTKTRWFSSLITVLIAIITTLCTVYFSEKGKNLATKQDIEVITSKIEQVKAKIESEQEVAKLKRELKYKALLHSLSIIDAYLSNFLKLKNGRNIQKQFASVTETRECHNNLILTCENPELLILFGKIMSGKRGMNDKEIDELLRDLNEYRNLVRTELGFGDKLKLDSSRVWFADVIFDKVQTQN